MSTSEPVPIDAQIACIEREIGFRERLYPRWVKSLKLTQAAADEELARMTAVLKTLNRIRMAQDHHVPNAGRDPARRRGPGVLPGGSSPSFVEVGGPAAQAGGGQ